MITTHASGFSGDYGAWKGTPLGCGVMYAQALVDRNREDSFLHHITNTSLSDEIAQGVHTIHFRTPLSVGGWRPFELNQQFVLDEPSSKQFCIHICNAAYKAVKLDELNAKEACADWAGFQTEVLDGMVNGLYDQYHAYVLNSMLVQTPTRNSGANAGRYGDTNLGTLNAPVNVNKDNLANFLASLQRVLEQAKRWYSGEMFLVVPSDIKSVLFQLMLEKQMCCDVNSSIMFKGLVANEVMGFKLIESDRIKPVMVGGKLVYPILAGWREAFAFGGDIVYADVKDIPLSTGIYYAVVTKFGGGVVYPEGLARAYVTFDF